MCVIIIPNWCTCIIPRHQSHNRGGISSSATGCPRMSLKMYAFWDPWQSPQDYLGIQLAMMQHVLYIVHVYCILGHPLVPHFITGTPRFSILVSNVGQHYGSWNTYMYMYIVLSSDSCDTCTVGPRILTCTQCTCSILGFPRQPQCVQSTCTYKYVHVRQHYGSWNTQMQYPGQYMCICTNCTCTCTYILSERGTTSLSLANKSIHVLMWSLCMKDS